MERIASRLPTLAPDCAGDGRAGTGELRIEGVDNAAVLARPPGNLQPLRLSLRAIGAMTRVRWLLDGRAIGESDGPSHFPYALDAVGEHELTALADSGAWARVRFRLLR
jgi:penicillin-binding protein 1C